MYKIIDDGYNGRLGDRPVIGVDISDEIGADRPVKIIQGGGTRIYIGRNKSTGLSTGLREKG